MSKSEILKRYGSEEVARTTIKGMLVHFRYMVDKFNLCRIAVEFYELMIEDYESRLIELNK